jgi:hypothetical protein
LIDLLGCHAIRLIAQRKLAEALAQAVIMWRAAAVSTTGSTLKISQRFQASLRFLLPRIAL